MNRDYQVDADESRIEATAARGPRLAVRPASNEHFFIPSARLFDPAIGLDRVADLHVAAGSIRAIGENLPRPPEAEVLSGLSGACIFPGFVDAHAHLRTPGQEHKEDLTSGTLAAAAGGYVLVTAMANTVPPIDSGQSLRAVLDRAGREAMVLVGQVGAVSAGLEGRTEAAYAEMTAEGALAFSDDGLPVWNTSLLEQALQSVFGGGRPLLLHLEDKSLWRSEAPAPFLPPEAETGPLAQALGLVRRICSTRNESPARLVHLQHLSVAASLEPLAAARADGLPVTAEVTPHHLLLSRDDLMAGGEFPASNLKMNPPLRTAEDTRALIEALAKGLIDCVATDHAPHSAEEKARSLAEAPFGTTGLETAFSVLYAGLVRTGLLSLSRLVYAMSTAPCSCLGIPAPRLEVGSPAHFCVVDLEREWTVGPEDLRGKAKNCAFLGKRAQGRILTTVVAGARRFVAG